MLVELTSNKEAQLNKWFRVISMNGEIVNGVYVRFGLARDKQGNCLYTIPKTDEPVYVELEYNGVHYP